MQLEKPKAKRVVVTARDVDEDPETSKSKTLYNTTAAEVIELLERSVETSAKRRTPAASAR